MFKTLFLKSHSAVARMRRFMCKCANDKKDVFRRSPQLSEPSGLSSRSPFAVFPCWPHLSLPPPPLYPVSCFLAARHKSSVWNGNTHVTGVPHMFIFKAFSSFFSALLQRQHLNNTREGNHWKVWFNWQRVPPPPQIQFWSSHSNSLTKSLQCINQRKGRSETERGSEGEKEEEVWFCLTREADRGGKNVLSSRWTH